MTEDRLDGTLVSVDARGVWVVAAGERLFCRVRGRFYEEPGAAKRPVAPGDRVTVSRISPGEGVVEVIHPRRTWLSRPSGHRGEQEQVIAANVDRLAIVVSVKRPPLRPGLIDRLLVASVNQRIEPFVVLNKIDLDREGIAGWVRETYEELDYQVLVTSAVEKTGIESLKESLEGRITVFVGHSGVGKTSLLNALAPELGLRVGKVSRSTRKGRHITTRAELLPLPFEGFVVDTPGVRAFGLWNLEPADLDIFFAEFEPFIEQCRFHNCSHSHEPGCAVRAAVESGEILSRRHAAYLRILHSLEEDTPHR